MLNRAFGFSSILLIKMAFNYLSIFIIMFSLIGICSADLSSDYYDKSCPKAMYTIKNAVANAVTKERRMGASLLRLHFHDCFVNAR